MARGKKKETGLTPEEKLEQALVPDWEWPYKVPKNWCWARIGAISDFERGITFPASAKEDEPTDENIPCLRTANVQENLEIDDLIYVNQSFMKDNEAKLVRENDIIMSSANSRELVGKASFVTHVPFPMTFGGFVLNIRARGISSKYLFYFLRQEFLAGKFMGESTQTTNIANINTTTLGGYELPLPPLAEQQRIIDRIEYLFAKLDEAKEKAQSVLDSFETRKAAILHKAFTGELTAKWRAEHGVAFDGWYDATVGNLFEVFSGKGFKEKEYSVSGIKLLRISNVTYDELVWEDTKYLPVKYLESVPELVLQSGDIVMALNRPITNGKLKVSIVDDRERYILYQRVGCLRKRNPENSTQYLQYALLNRSFLHQVESHLQGSDQPYINLPPLKSLTISMCSEYEQKEVVRILDSLFAKEQQAKEAAEAVLEKIDLLKRSILARAFRGELGTNDPTEQSALELLKQVLQEDVPAATRKRSKSIPKEMQAKLATELERKIVKLYFKHETDSLPAEELLSVSSKIFEIMGALHNLEHAGILKRLPNGNYRLLE